MGDRLKNFGKGFGEFLSVVGERLDESAQRAREADPNYRLNRAIENLKKLEYRGELEDQTILTDMLFVQESLGRANEEATRPWRSISSPRKCSVFTALSDCEDRNCTFHSTAKERWERDHGLR